MHHCFIFLNLLYMSINFGISFLVHLIIVIVWDVKNFIVKPSE